MIDIVLTAESLASCRRPSAGGKRPDDLPRSELQMAFDSFGVAMSSASRENVRCVRPAVRKRNENRAGLRYPPRNFAAGVSDGRTDEPWPVYPNHTTGALWSTSTTK
jgi:hypothetical protein